MDVHHGRGRHIGRVDLPPAGRALARRSSSPALRRRTGCRSAALRLLVGAVPRLPSGPAYRRHRAAPPAQRCRAGARDLLHGSRGDGRLRVRMGWRRSRASRLPSRSERRCRGRSTRPAARGRSTKTVAVSCERSMPPRWAPVSSGLRCLCCHRHEAGFYWFQQRLRRVPADRRASLYHLACRRHNHAGITWFLGYRLLPTLWPTPDASAPRACSSKFNNLPNYLGFDYIPELNPYDTSFGPNAASAASSRWAVFLLLHRKSIQQWLTQPVDWFSLSFALMIVGELLRPKPKFRPEAEQPRMTSASRLRRKGVHPDFRRPCEDRRPNVTCTATEGRSDQKKQKTGLFSSKKVTVGYKYYLACSTPSCSATRRLHPDDVDDKAVELKGKDDHRGHHRLHDGSNQSYSGPKLIGKAASPARFAFTVARSRRPRTPTWRPRSASVFGLSARRASHFGGCYLGNSAVFRRRSS